MKKLLLIISVLGLLTACGTSKEGVDVSKNNFEEVETVDIEISDYVGDQSQENTELTPPAEPETSEQPSTEPSEKEEVKEETKETVKQESKPATNPSTVTEKQTQTSKAPAKAEKPKEPIKKEPIDLSNKIICIDAGHGTFAQGVYEAVAPGSDTQKPGFTQGVVGVHTTEDKVSLAVANIVKEKLEAMGATIVMTRTSDDTNLSNAKRAEFANDSGADIIIKLHADGASKTGNGMTMLIPGDKYIKNANLLINAKNLARHILNNSVAQTGAKNRGVHITNDMAGLNWSKIPVVLFEMGYMTNPDDEAKLMNAAYQNKIAQGIADGICDYYR